MTRLTTWPCTTLRRTTTNRAALLFWTLRDVCRHGFLPTRRIDALTNCLELMGKLLPRIDDPKKIAKYAFRDLHKHISSDAG